MRIFKNKRFARFARQQGITDGDLCEASDRAERGLVDADLGGGVIKQRIARPHEGRSGGFRSIIYFRAQERSVFAFGFAKNKMDNISADDLKILKRTAQVTLALTETELQELLDVDKLIEVKCNEEDV